MKILLTGANGQLGWELSHQSKKQGYELWPTDIPELDITNQSQVEKAITDIQPDIVINSAAYTNVDKAEHDKYAAFAINKEGPEVLARLCNTYGCALIHVSTDYVFNGTQQTPYLESDPIHPLGVYGKSKAEGESAIIANLHQYFIIRTSWLYGVQGHNFVKTMLRLGKEREILRVVTDQIGCPTATHDLADAILKIVAMFNTNTSTMPWGIYHYCGKGITSWHEFAKTIFDIASQYMSLKIKEVQPILSVDYPQDAKRPSYSALDCQKIHDVIGIETRPWQESLKHVIHRIVSEKLLM